MPFIEIQTRKLAGLISGARFFSVEDAAHLPCMEQLETMAGSMMQFFPEVQIG